MEVREQKEELIRRLPILRVGFLVALAVIGSFYWFVQVVQGSSYRERAENNRLRKGPIRAPRGLIYDRQGRLLADNVPSYDLYLDRSEAADPAASLEFASAVLGREVEQLRATLDRFQGSSRFTPVLLAQGLPLSQVAGFSARALEYPEFEIKVGQLRLYRHGPLTAHVLGYLGQVTERDILRSEGSLSEGDLVGRRGIEKSFDGRLRGRDGQRVAVVDSRGRQRDEYGSERAVPGEDHYLTLDLELQQIAARFFEERVGAAVALDPRNGEILVFVSAPSYDSNQFARGLAPAEWQEIVQAPHNPLHNRVLQSEYSPGSIFKIVVAAAGLSDGVVDVGDSVYCRGSTRIYNRRYRCWKRAGHGTVNLREAVRQSCDVYFYHLGQKLGIARLSHYARQFGLGTATGIDVEGERAGLVPDREWSLRRRGTPWVPGETISVAIGQGPLLVTPLQIASLMAIVGNGGQRVTPHLGKRNTAPPVVPSQLDARALATVGEALWAVVNDNGTGRTARVEGFEVAGKTGTVQVVSQRTWIDSDELPFEQRDHAWFAAYGPTQAPELVVVVFVEHGGKGSEQAAPLARMIYETYHRNRQSAVAAS